MRAIGFDVNGSPDDGRLAGEVAYALGLGYDEVFVRDEFADAVRGVDLVLDPVGGPVREAGLKVLAPFGTTPPTAARSASAVRRSPSTRSADSARRCPGCCSPCTSSRVTRCTPSVWSSTPSRRW
jgi:hypothetical protein